MNLIVDEVARRASVELTDDQRAKLDRYLDLLLEANQRMNLTRITDRAAAELHHLADALTLLPFLLKGSHNLADVGSGGGVPGIPLAIARPDAQVTLIESTRKKAIFLREAIATLELGNVQVSDRRVEEVARSGETSRESFDVAVARAVATMEWLAEWCLPLVKVGGKMLAMKGPRVRDELPIAARGIRIFGGGEPVVHPVDLPGTDQRVIVEIPKRTRSDKRYPRDPTFAKGKPI
jgi:16S rRNA (guanine527-N7)-methyltransferase